MCACGLQLGKEAEVVDRVTQVYVLGAGGGGVVPLSVEEEARSGDARRCGESLSDAGRSVEHAGGGGSGRRGEGRNSLYSVLQGKIQEFCSGDLLITTRDAINLNLLSTLSFFAALSVLLLSLSMGGKGGQWGQLETGGSWRRVVGALLPGGVSARISFSSSACPGARRRGGGARGVGAVVG